jgi:hypothetical protein
MCSRERSMARRCSLLVCVAPIGCHEKSQRPFQPIPWFEQEAFGSRPVDRRFGDFSRGITNTEEINEAPTTQIAFDTCAQQQKLPQHDGGPQDELDLPRNSSGAFERVRAEMIKLGALGCVRPSVRHE